MSSFVECCLFEVVKHFLMMLVCLELNQFLLLNFIKKPFLFWKTDSMSFEIGGNSIKIRMLRYTHRIFPLFLLFFNNVFVCKQLHLISTKLGCNWHPRLSLWCHIIVFSHESFFFTTITP